MIFVKVAVICILLCGNKLDLNLNLNFIVAYGTLRLTLQWRHNGHGSVSNHQPYDCLLNRLFKAQLKGTSKLRVAGLCAVNSPGTGEFPAQMASNAENVSIWWRHHANARKSSEIALKSVDTQLKKWF